LDPIASIVTRLVPERGLVLESTRHPNALTTDGLPDRSAVLKGGQLTAMKILIRIIGAILVVAALIVWLETPMFVTGPSGTTLLTAGMLIDVVAFGALALGVWAWRRASRITS
jgi:F0F1-type ATP synthase assembly protein I